MKSAIKRKRIYQVIANVFGRYPEFLMQSFPVLLAGAIITIVFRGNILIDLMMLLANVFIFGALFLQGEAVLKHDFIAWKTIFTTVTQRYLPSLGLAFCLMMIGFFALFLPGFVYFILPNFILAKIIHPALIALLGLGSLLAIGSYVFFSANFFWMENKSIEDAMQASVDLVKPQWKRVASYLLLVTLLLSLPTLCLIALTAAVMSKTVFFGIIFVAATYILTLPLWMIFPTAFFHEFNQACS